MDIVTLKYSSGHLIKIIRGVRRGYKYFGIYSKKLNKQEEKHNVKHNNRIVGRFAEELFKS